MILHTKVTTAELKRLRKRGEIALGGNLRDKIYGTLKCKQGKRLDPANRVFFASEEEAAAHGFRPCGSCMRKEYKAWKERR